MAKIKWFKSPTGNLMSEATRFLIGKPLSIKAGTITVNGQLTGFVPETRVKLIDRFGQIAPTGKAQRKTYLCLSVEDAMNLAEDLAAGKGVLSP